MPCRRKKRKKEERMPPNLFQRGHPASGQVTILEDNPRALLDRRVDEAQGNRTLALAQRQRLQLVAAEAAVVGELEERDHGVAARRQNEDEGAGGRGVAVGLGEVEGRRLDVLLAEAGAHKLLC